MGVRFVHCLLFVITFFFPEMALCQLDQEGVSDNIIIDRILIIGNQKTREHVILREMTVEMGRNYSLSELDALIKESSEHLRNIELFNFVDIQKISTETPGRIHLLIKVTERWYTWPVPLIESADRNINAWWKHKKLSRLSYGLDLQQRNFRGRRETLHLKFLTGYDENYVLLYEIPYLKANKMLGLNFEVSYAQNHEVNFQTHENQSLFFQQEEEIAQQNYSLWAELIFRRSIYMHQAFSIGYSHFNFSDSLIIKNPAYSFNNQSTLNYLFLRYYLKLDHRNYRSYPTKGWYVDAGLNKSGLGLLQKKGLNTYSLEINLRKYWQINPKMFFASGLIGFLASDQSPYYMGYGIGYLRNIVRGYENYIVDANRYAILKTNLKFKLFENRDKEIRLTRSEKFDRLHYAFFLNVYSDLGYTQNALSKPEFENSFQNTWLAGYGLGLDFVTYYDKVFRFEYSLNKHGGRAFFIHFIAPV